MERSSKAFRSYEFSKKLFGLAFCLQACFYLFYKTKPQIHAPQIGLFYHLGLREWQIHVPN